MQLTDARVCGLLLGQQRGRRRVLARQSRRIKSKNPYACGLACCASTFARVNARHVRALQLRGGFLLLEAEAVELGELVVLSGDLLLELLDALLDLLDLSLILLFLGLELVHVHHELVALGLVEPPMNPKWTIDVNSCTGLAAGRPASEHHLKLPAVLLDAVLAIARLLQDALGRLEVLLELVARLFQFEHLRFELRQSLVLLLVLALQLVKVAAQLALDLVALELLEQRLDLFCRSSVRRSAFDRPMLAFGRRGHWIGFARRHTYLAVQLPPRPLVQVDEDHGIPLNDADGILTAVGATVAPAGQEALRNGLEARNQLAELAGGATTERSQ